jgi:hypothetical protein
MIIGFLLLGWIGGATAAALHVASDEGTWLGALGLFVLVGNLSVLVLAGLAYLRSVIVQGKAERSAVLAPAVPCSGNGSGRSH